MRPRRWAAWALLGALWLTPPPALAAGPRGQGGEELAAPGGLGIACRRLALAAAARREGPGGERLGLHLQAAEGSAWSLLAAELLAAGPFSEVVAVADLEAARAAGLDAFLSLSLGWSGDEVFLEGSLTGLDRNFFTGALRQPPAPLLARAPAGPRAALLLSASREGPVALAPVSLTHLLDLEGEVVAVALGATPEGAAVAALREGSLELWRWRGGGLEPWARRDLRDRPRAAIESRDPSGGLIFTAQRGAQLVAYHHSTLKAGELLRIEGEALRPISAAPGVPLWGGAAGAVWGAQSPGRATVEGRLRWVPAEGPPRRFDAGGPVWSAACEGACERLWVVDAEGSLRPLLPEGTRGRAKVSPRPAGVGLVTVALDGAGPLWASSAAGLPGPHDQLQLRSRLGVLRYQIELPGQIRALAAGPLPGGGEALLVATWRPSGGSALYLLRGAP